MARVRPLFRPPWLEVGFPSLQDAPPPPVLFQPLDGVVLEVEFDGGVLGLDNGPDPPQEVGGQHVLLHLALQRLHLGTQGYIIE